MKGVMVSRKIYTLVTISILAAGCAHVDRDPAGQPENASNFTYIGPRHTEEREMIEQITSIFENASPKFTYAYVERLKDSSIRGITFGRIGFTTCQDGKDLVLEYDRLRPKNRLHKFLSAMLDGFYKKINCDENVRRLESAKPSFSKVFVSLAKDPLLRQAQDNVENDRYYQPAMGLADSLGLKLPWSRLVIYDSYIQHGEGFGDGKDIGIEQIVSQTKLQLQYRTPLGNGFGVIDEVTWMLEFLRQRRLFLANGDEEWQESVGRIDDLVAIHARDHNDQLQPYTFRSKEYGNYKLPIQQ
jgi:hypothetical protein